MAMKIIDNDLTIQEVCGHMEKGQYVYILECRDSTYYTGYTTDVDKRLETHNLGKGAKYTRSRRPCKLVYVRACESKSKALKLEYKIKQMSRKEKSECSIVKLNPIEK